MRNADLIADTNLKRQKAAENFLKRLQEESEELERTESSYKERFSNQIDHLKLSAKEHIRSRSSEEDRRALLQSLRNKHEKIVKETENAEQFTELIENQIERIKEDLAEESRILEMIESAKPN